MVWGEYVDWVRYEPQQACKQHASMTFRVIELQTGG
jgi:hypothetical protein